MHERLPQPLTILGAGRLGQSLAVYLERAGVPARLAGRGASLEAHGAVVLCVRDDDLAAVAATLPSGTLALHTSGLRGGEVFPAGVVGGVFHPLMTFPGPEHGLPDVRGVAARVAGHPRAVALAGALAEALGMRAVALDDGTRWHAAACLVSGHLGALFLEASTLLEACGLSAEEARATLLPLARVSLENAGTYGADALTGPAVRGDATTEAAHLAALPETVSATYRGLADAIRRLRGGSV